MKKIVLILLFAAAMFAALSGCANYPNGVVNVYNWGEYMDTDLNKEFEKEFGIKVNYKQYETNEMMYSYLKSGGAGYDVIIPSDYMIGRLIEEDMLEELNFSNIPNFSDIKPELKNPGYDPQNKFSVPYAWGIVGLIYDGGKINENLDSWGALFDVKYSGQLLMFDNSRDAFGIALKYLGYSLNTENEDEIYEAFELLKRQKPLVQAYTMDQIFDKLGGGEALLGPYYAGDYFTMLEDNPALIFAVPKEGTNKFVDAMCIPKGADNKENAEKYINFMTSTKAALANAEVTCYSTPVISAFELLDDDVKNDGISYPGADILARCEEFMNLSEKTRKLYADLWTQLISG
ncbi:MAG: spermidine/putrescine ABC transporter substrate-binding protein [Oscillospiraceae bacterium]|nr:spermidine/putrescine ABC transporter substrate-binding protein [Oscillospiraceae bacterium]